MRRAGTATLGLAYSAGHFSPSGRINYARKLGGWQTSLELSGEVARYPSHARLLDRGTDGALVRSRKERSLGTAPEDDHPDEQTCRQAERDRDDDAAQAPDEGVGEAAHEERHHQECGEADPPHPTVLLPRHLVRGADASESGRLGGGAGVVLACHG